MPHSISRRGFLATTAATGLAAASTSSLAASRSASQDSTESAPAPLKLGIMTYTLGAAWDLDTLIANCVATKFEHIELRTTHAHGVEVSLSANEREAVKKKCEDAGLKVSLASGFSYHSDDPAELRKNIEGTKEYTLLAKDIGALGIRVFPNAVPPEAGEEQDRTMERIGKAAAEVGTFAADYNVEIRLANHGRHTNRVPILRKILDYADCPHVYVNWNCDRTDIEEPGFEANFNSVKDKISNIHLHDLSDGIYPYRKLFSMLTADGYQGYCDAEVSASQEPLVFMRYYRALFLALQNVI
jgi:sugar phosphate isomerase/epimerase